MAIVVTMTMLMEAMAIVPAMTVSGAVEAAFEVRTAVKVWTAAASVMMIAGIGTGVGSVAAAGVMIMAGMSVRGLRAPVGQASGFALAAESLVAAATCG
jgi:hypothetical protein